MLAICASCCSSLPSPFSPAARCWASSRYKKTEADVDIRPITADIKEKLARLRATTTAAPR